MTKNVGSPTFPMPHQTGNNPQQRTLENRGSWNAPKLTEVGGFTPQIWSTRAAEPRPRDFASKQRPRAQRHEWPLAQELTAEPKITTSGSNLKPAAPRGVCASFFVFFFWGGWTHQDGATLCWNRYKGVPTPTKTHKFTTDC